MSEPYFLVKAGATIQSRQWNEIQIRLRDEVQNHTHSGGDQGTKLTGDAIDAGSALTVKTLAATAGLSIGSPPQFVVNAAGNVGLGTTDLGKDRLRVIGTLRTDLLRVTGDADITGGLKAAALAITGVATAGSLSVQNGVISNGPTPVEGTQDLGLYSQTPGTWMRLVTRDAPLVFFTDGGIGTNKVHEFHANGDITFNWQQNPLRISSGWNSFAGGEPNRAEISNDVGTYKCLMVVGNNASGTGRTVGIWDHLNVAGRTRVGAGLSIGNNAATRMLQIGGTENGIGMDASDASPNAGYIRFGDNSGWRLHFARAKDSAAGAPNQGPASALMTIHDSGQVSIGTVNPSEQVRLRVHGPSVANCWSGRITAGGDSSVIVAGEHNKLAILGAHNGALGAWDDLYINPHGGRIVIGTTTAESANLTVEGTTVFRTGGAGDWNRLVVGTSKEWGDTDTQYVTLGAGGASGIMLSNPHVTWRDDRASIRYGRTGGTPGNTFWDAGVRPDGSFSFVPSNNCSAEGQEPLKVDRNATITFGGRAPLRVTHGWTSFPDGNPEAAEISNDIDLYKTLMIVGNRAAGAERRVGLWDRVDVHGALYVDGHFQVRSANVAIDSSAMVEPDFRKQLALRVYSKSVPGQWCGRIVSGGDNDMVIVGSWNSQAHIGAHNNTLDAWADLRVNSGGRVFLGAGDGVLVDNGNVLISGNFGKQSTLRVKHNIRPLTGCLALIDRLTPIQYDHRDDPNSRNNYGFIAEEVREVIPDVVRAADPEHPAFFAGSLSQDSLLGLALAGIQELGRKVDRLERQLHGQPGEPTTPANSRDALEILAEQTYPRKRGGHDDYVAVRFTTADPLLGARQVVRYLRLPPDLDRHEYLMGELMRWKHGLTPAP